jgi:thiamine pyrophosphokinase
MHPTDKDATDLELALRHAVDLGARHITVVGGAGGRADHHLANVAALAAPYLADVEVVAQLGAARCTVVRREAQLLGVPGSLVSLLPIGAPASGVTTHGMRWELLDAHLEPHSTRGISNELLGRLATVRLAAGVLLAVQPHSGAHGEPDRTPMEG